MALGHLRRDAELRIHAVERVEDHEAVVAGDIGGGDMRIEDAEIRLRDELQHPVAGRLRQRRGAEGTAQRHAGTAKENVASKHGPDPAFVATE